MKKVFKHFLIITSLFGLLLATACSNKINKEETKEKNIEITKEKTELEELEEEKIENEGIEIFDKMEFSVLENEAEIGTFEIDLKDPKSEYEIGNGVKLVLAQYYPDYILVDGEPQSESDYPINPAFIFTIGEDIDTETMFVGIGNNIAAEDDSTFKINIVDYSLRE